MKREGTLYIVYGTKSNDFTNSYLVKKSSNQVKLGAKLKPIILLIYWPNIKTLLNTTLVLWNKTSRHLTSNVVHNRTTISKIYISRPNHPIHSNLVPNSSQSSHQSTDQISTFHSTPSPCYDLKCQGTQRQCRRHYSPRPSASVSPSAGLKVQPKCQHFFRETMHKKIMFVMTL